LTEGRTLTIPGGEAHLLLKKFGQRGGGRPEAHVCVSDVLCFSHLLRAS
jgi:hypothetical protein